MRLLTYDNADKLIITRDRVNATDTYAILSHTWGSDEDEVVYQDLQCEPRPVKQGFKKIDFCGQQARKDSILYFWVDTCCIDKFNHVELSEAINSMFKWYQQARVCYVYLSDVTSGPRWQAEFKSSRWFTRGWTLQELLAPSEVVFFSKAGKRLGTKHELVELISSITAIPIAALQGQALTHFSPDERMQWTKNRSTTKKEDQAYCLFGIFNVYLPLIYGEGDYAFVRLTEAITKAPQATLSLRTVEEAAFDAYGQVHQECHPETRTDLLQQIRNWAQDMEGPSIFWLNGGAGTGKSTISCTVARKLSQRQFGQSAILGASFFFKRGEGSRSSASLLFPTIATQLAGRIPQLDVFISQAVKADPQICSKALAEQFRKLIVEPLRRLPKQISKFSYVLVLDALDECDKEDDIRTILQLWATLPNLGHTRQRLFLTSRPELVIRLGMKQMSSQDHQDTVLHEVSWPIVEHDISAFLATKLSEIRDHYNLEAEDDALPASWPGSASVKKLTDISMPLFIVAATICRYIRDASRPVEGLDEIMIKGNDDLTSDTKQIYSMVLQASVERIRGSARVTYYQNFRSIVGAIVCLAEPLSRHSLSILLNFSSVDIRIQLQSLHAVLHVPVDQHALIRPLHLSFPEFLTSLNTDDDPFAIDPAHAHRELSRLCLALLSGPDGLRENICHLALPGQLRSEISQNQIDEFLTPILKYACQHLVFHLEGSGHILNDDDEVHMFLQHHFLHWLEALSLLDVLADAVPLVQRLQALLKKTESQVCRFLDDAYRFLLTNFLVTSLAPLQIYSSALIFAPQLSIIRKTCGRDPPWIPRVPVTPPQWGTQLLRLEGHQARTRKVAFSPSQSLLASASDDGTVRLWEVSTGQQMQQFKLAELWQSDSACVRGMAFSPDGQFLALCSDTRQDMIFLWHISTGQHIGPFGHFEGQVCFAAPVWYKTSTFSSLFASIAFWDPTARRWQISQGQAVRELRHQSNAAYFLRDGYLQTSEASDASAACLTDGSCWEMVRPLRGIYGDCAIAYSPDGQFFADNLGENKHALRLVASSTNDIVCHLRGHTATISDVAFSPDGSLMATASFDHTLGLWQTPQNIKKVTTSDVSVQDPQTDLRSHEQLLCVLFSPTGKLLASTYSSGRIALWLAATGERQVSVETESFLGSIVFSPDGSLLAWDYKREIQIRTGTSAELLQQFTTDAEDPFDLLFSPHNTLLASISHTGSGGKLLQIWDIWDGQVMWELEVAFDIVKLLCFSYDEHVLAYGNATGGSEAITVQNLLTLEQILLEIQVFPFGLASVIVAAFSATGSLLAAAFRNGFLIVWELSTKRQMLCKFFNENIEQIQFNGDELVTNIGHISLKTYEIVEQLKPSLFATLKLYEQWITYRGKRILWLPHEFRIDDDARKDRLCIFRNRVALVLSNGSVTFMEIDLEQCLNMD